jgi:hypothetical protein
MPRGEYTTPGILRQVIYYKFNARLSVLFRLGHLVVAFWAVPHQTIIATSQPPARTNVALVENTVLLVVALWAERVSFCGLSNISIFAVRLTDASVSPSKMLATVNVLLALAFVV